MDEQRENKLDIEIDPNVAEGVYSNLAVISHSGTEFVVDFLQMLPGLQKPMVRTTALLPCVFELSKLSIHMGRVGRPKRFCSPPKIRAARWSGFSLSS